ncbi:MAG: hypothetical protein V4577_24235 [Bacteroidota bacterium]
MSRIRLSKNLASGISSMANKHEKIRGDKISFANITSAPRAKRLNSTQASLM